MEKTTPSKRPQLIGIADNIRSLHNVGALFRTADGAGVEALILCGITGQPPRNEIRKTALGAEDFVPWQYRENTLSAIKELKTAGYHIIALEKNDHSQLLYEIELQLPVALIAGNEYWGISNEVLNEADSIVHVPMFGQKISLNVSVAFGIAAYEIKRQIGTS